MPYVRVVLKSESTGDEYPPKTTASPKSDEKFRSLFYGGNTGFNYTGLFN
jgi:hypothetical protein